MAVATKTRKRSSVVKPRRDVYAEVTNAIVAQLEAGAGSWKLPWRAIASGPRNVTSKKLYRGINAFLLAVEALEKGYTSPTWGTYNQWAEKGCQVRKGEKSSTAVLWKPFEKREADADGTETVSKRLLIRAFAIFNAEQVDGYAGDPDIVPVHSEERVDAAEEFIAHTGAEINFGGARAYYTPSADKIQLPTFESFESANHYYSTAAHELTHWTGHETRLNRDLANRFGDEQYAFEELIAELGSAFVCAHLGLESEPREDHAAYLASWIRALRSDNRAIFTVAAAAQKACDFLIGASASEEADDTVVEVAA